ncbi:MAG: peptidoglycan DD-metalloendopeptidase family protein [Bacteroidetes bacterium]|nr:peptidoglycan DD-metalloendopeptidase family protein [Bacteroidota bacterium]
MAIKLSRIKDFFTKKIRNRYRLIIRNDHNLEERISVVLTPLNLILIVSGLMVVFTTIIILILPFTPVGDLLPGRNDVNSKSLRTLQRRLDDMERQMESQREKDSMLREILKEAGQPTSMVSKRDVHFASFFPFNLFSTTTNAANPEEKSAAQKAKPEIPKPTTDHLSSYVFFTPLKGIITDTFNIRSGHTAVDIVSYSNAAVKSTLDGTVILSSWTPETGHVMVIQHRDNIISVYKHNSALLKKQGALVQAGEVIALVGNSGELTTGPHLHFELWQNGRSVDPQDYILF